MNLKCIAKSTCGQRDCTDKHNVYVSLLGTDGKDIGTMCLTASELEAMIAKPCEFEAHFIMVQADELEKLIASHSAYIKKKDRAFKASQEAYSRVMNE